MRPPVNTCSTKLEQQQQKSTNKRETTEWHAVYVGGGASKQTMAWKASAQLSASGCNMALQADTFEPSVNWNQTGLWGGRGWSSLNSDKSLLLNSQ